ncbi:MAG: hypothetical protein ACLRVT_04755 [Oscillospiraceae bacterium]
MSGMCCPYLEGMLPGAQARRGPAFRLDNGINFILDDEGERVICSLPLTRSPTRSTGGCVRQMEAAFSFPMGEEQIGGQLKAGFTLLDLYEDSDRTGNLHDRNIPQYFATFSRKGTRG